MYVFFAVGQPEGFAWQRRKRPLNVFDSLMRRAARFLTEIKFQQIVGSERFRGKFASQYGSRNKRAQFQAPGFGRAEAIGNIQLMMLEGEGAVETSPYYFRFHVKT